MPDNASSNRGATCYVCGHDAGDSWFDRTLCACDTMHTRCCNCGAALDDCPYEQVEPHAIPNSAAGGADGEPDASAGLGATREGALVPGRANRNRVSDLDRQLRELEIQAKATDLETWKAIGAARAAIRRLWGLVDA